MQKDKTSYQEFDKSHKAQEVRSVSISIEDCRKHLRKGGIKMTNEDIKVLREVLRLLAEVEISKTKKQ